MAKKSATEKNAALSGIQRIAQQVDLRDVRQVVCKSYLILHRDDSPPTQLNQSISIKPGLDIENKELTYMITLDLVGGQSRKDPEHPSLFIEAVFAVTYGLQSTDGIREDKVIAFGQLNGVFNVWPYWREFVQSMTCRMGLPGLRSLCSKSRWILQKNRKPGEIRRHLPRRK